MKKEDIIKKINENCKFLNDEPSLYVRKMSKIGICISELKTYVKDYELSAEDVLDIISIIKND